MKFIITLTMPSGTKFAFSMYKESFALVPIEQNGTVKHCSSWNTEEKARKYLEEMLERNPGIKKLAPFQIQNCMEPQ